MAEDAARAPGRRSRSPGGVQKNFAARIDAIAAAQGVRRLEIWFEDEARIGQKGRVGHRWFTRGQRPPGLCDKRFDSTYLFAAARPGTDDAFALVLPEATTQTMNLFLRGFADQLAADVHAVLVVDGAGWHIAHRLAVPDNVSLLFLPPYSPELNPVERIWLFLRERFLSHRLHPHYDDIVDAACNAWNALRAEPGRIASLTNFPWIRCVTGY